jgi:hypothetical protein
MNGMIAFLVVVAILLAIIVILGGDEIDFDMFD